MQMCVCQVSSGDRAVAGTDVGAGWCKVTNQIMNAMLSVLKRSSWLSSIIRKWVAIAVTVPTWIESGVRGGHSCQGKMVQCRHNMENENINLVPKYVGRALLWQIIPSQKIVGP